VILESRFADLHYAEDIAVLVYEPAPFVQLLLNMEILEVWTTCIMVQNPGAGNDANDVIIDGNKVDNVTEFIYLTSKLLSHTSLDVPYSQP